MNLKHLQTTVACWLIVGLPVGQIFGGSAVLRPSADTSLFAFGPDSNLGATPNLLVGVNGTGFPGRGLMRFNLAGVIPSNAVIQSVTLAVQVVTVPAGGGVASTFDLRRVLADWGEGAGTGNTGTPATVGDATWNNRFHPATPWNIPGGAVTNDFATNISALLPIGNEGSYTFLSNSNLVADVQLWVTNPATNFGWVLISESEDTLFTARRFASREDTNRAPVLAVQYVLPSAPDIQWIKAVGNQIQISFSAVTGHAYIVQFRESLGADNWLTLTNIPAQSVATNLVIFDSAPANMQRFYRIGQF